MSAKRRPALAHEESALTVLGSHTLSRRDLLKASGALVVGFSLLGSKAFTPGTAAAQSQSAVPADALDSWLSVAEDGTVTLFTGKVDLGTGLETAMAQIAAEELDVAFSAMRVVQGDTALTVDQGSTNGSTSIARGGPQVRQAAAEARQALLELASERLGVPAEQLSVKDGLVSTSDASKHVSYAELVGGVRIERPVSDTATVKNPDQYTVVGQPIARVDIPSKVTGSAVYVQDVRVPGMVHGRTVKPPAIGSMLVSVDETSVRDVPGLIKVVVRGNFVGVVAEREENALKAAQQLKVTWSEWAGLPRMPELYNELRRYPSVENVVTDEGDVDASLGAAAKRLEASYNFPFQTHGSIGPSCAVADVRGGEATIWSSSQGPYAVRQKLAALLDVSPDKVRVIWAQGAGSYGNVADDATLDAALLSQVVGRPVRLQWMREDEHRWTSSGPAMVIDLRGGLDSAGRIAGWSYDAYTPSHFYGDNLNAALINGEMAVPVGPPPRTEPWGGDSRHAYSFDGSVREVVHRLQQTPLRSNPLRAPGQIATTFAGESFMDEMAAAAGIDPIEFRLQHMTDERAVAVMRAAAERAGWVARNSPKGPSTSGVVTGRGIALARLGSPTTYVAMVAEVEVDRQTGKVALKRAVVAQDNGLTINPDGVANQIEGNIIQTTSRVLKEQLTFDESNVTSVDWLTYPILTFNEVPEVVTVIVDRPNLPSSGVGEPSSCPVAAAIANAIFDASGARVREVPFTPERVKAALPPG